MFVTFDLAPAAQGTLVRMTETGFREMGWEIAVLEEQYNEHVEGLEPLHAHAWRDVRRRRLVPTP